MNQEKWELIKETVDKKLNLSQVSANTWLKRLNVEEEGDKYFIIVPSDMRMAEDYLQYKFAVAFREVLSEMLGRMVEVEFSLHGSGI